MKFFKLIGGLNVGACVVTFTVGGLSVLNAIAGFYNENLPLVCIVGGPNSNNHGTNRILHHTIGLPYFSKSLGVFRLLLATRSQSEIQDDGGNNIDGFSPSLKKNIAVGYI